MFRRACRWRILPALLLGAATTVVVAWSSLLWPEPAPRPFSTRDSFRAEGPIPSSGLPDQVVEVFASRTPACATYSSTSQHIIADYFGPPPRTVPVSNIAPPQVLSLLSIGPGDSCTDRWVVARGWPYRALCSVSSFDLANVGPGPISTRTQFGIPLPQRWRRSFSRECLPLLPLLPGCLFDAALFAPAWWLLLSAPIAARGYFRRRRDVCTKCAYSRAGLAPSAPCPECGYLIR